MKCFNHSETDAVAICKSCYKALCHECASEVENGIACKGKCEEEVIVLNEMIQRNKNVNKRTANTYYRSSIIYFAGGLAFGGFGFYTDIDSLKSFLLVMGVIFIVAGVLTVVSARKIRN